MKNIVLGITGGIAAYKACDIANKLQKNKISVQVIMTQAAQKFITPLTFQSLTKNPVYTDMFEELKEVDIRHISIAQKADLCLIAPATANIIGKIANGIADDALSTVVMALKKGTPVIICPAMNNEMFDNIIVQKNIEKLKSFGYIFVEPKVGNLACGTIAKGALADVDEIVNEVLRRIN